MRRARTAANGPAILAIAAVLAVAASACGGGASTPQPTASPSPSESPSPTPSPTPAPTFGSFAIYGDHADVAATTTGVFFPWYLESAATRHPIAVMIDDHSAARPQSGLSQADIVYQATAEGGLPRYMAVFSTQLPSSIGPVRSSRMYFVAWAEEWNAMYVHHWGAPNAMARLAQINGKYIYNADGLKWEGHYLHRIKTRFSPHNLYTSGSDLEALANRLGATAPFTQSPFLFEDDLPAAERGTGGTLVIHYPASTITYRYDPATNTYPRAVPGHNPEIDLGNNQPIAPRNVVVLFQKTGWLGIAPGAANKGRLEIQYLGTGRALVYNNGLAIDATWTKKKEESPTMLTYASGPNAGQPVPMVRGQIFIQVVATDAKVTWTPAPAASPSATPSG